MARMAQQPDADQRLNIALRQAIRRGLVKGKVAQDGTILQGDSEWCVAAGKSRSALSNFRHRLRENPNHRMTLTLARDLARVAQVSFDWLQLGVGSMDAPAPNTAGRRSSSITTPDWLMVEVSKIEVAALRTALTRFCLLHRDEASHYAVVQLVYTKHKGANAVSEAAWTDELMALAQRIRTGMCAVLSDVVGVSDE
jgi:hypothetical protein